MTENKTREIVQTNDALVSAVANVEQSLAWVEQLDTIHTLDKINVASALRLLKLVQENTQREADKALEEASHASA